MHQSLQNGPQAVKFSTTHVAKQESYSRTCTLSFECCSFPSLALLSIFSPEHGHSQGAPRQSQAQEGRLPTLSSALCCKL